MDLSQPMLFGIGIAVLLVAVGLMFWLGDKPEDHKKAH